MVIRDGAVVRLKVKESPSGSVAEIVVEYDCPAVASGREEVVMVGALFGVIVMLLVVEAEMSSLSNASMT